MMKKRITVLVLLLAMVMTGITGKMPVNAAEVTVEDITTEAVKEQKGQFLVKIRYGIDSLITYNANIPVQVTITNQGEDFTGELTTTVVRDYYQSFGYSKDISLPAGAEKSYFMMIPADASFSNCIVRIQDAKGILQYERTIMNGMEQDMSCIIGVLCDDDNAMQYLDEMELNLQNGSYLFRVGRLTEETMPDTVSALSACKIIIIDNYDTSRLSDAQYTALKQWVENGGMLLLGTGAESSKTLSKFQDDFITGTVGTLEKKKIEMNGKSELVLEGTVTAFENDFLNLDVLNITMDGAEPVSQVAEGAVFLQKQLGLGKVVMSRISLTAEPFVSYKYNANIIGGLLTEIATQEFIDSLNGTVLYGNDLNINSYMITGVNDAKMPASGKYMLLFLIYVVVVGPGIYLLLRWRDKNKMLWAAIPMTAFLFTLGVYVVSLNDTVRTPMATSFSVEKYGENAKSVISGIEIKNPKSQAFEVNLDSVYTNVSPISADRDYSFVNQNQAVCIIKETVDHTILKQSKAQAFTPFYTKAEAVTPTDENIEIDIKAYRDGFTGTVTNHLQHDLVDVLVIHGNRAAYIERLGASETVELKKDDQKSITDMYQMTDLFLPVNAYATDRERYNRMQYLQEVFTQAYYNLKTEEGFVAGYVDGVTPDVITDETVTEYGAVVAYKPFSANYADVKGKYTSNIHNAYMTATSAEWDYTYGYMYGDTEIEAEYDFGEDAINTLYNTGMGSGVNRDPVGVTSSSYSYTAMAKCQIWNYETETWEELFAGDETVKTLTAQYLCEGMIKLRYLADTNTQKESIIPTIAGGEN